MIQPHPEQSWPANIRSNPDAAAYQIIVEGRLESKWASWFSGFTFSLSGETTILTGIAYDQAALFGLLAVLRDLNLPLVSVQRINDSGG